jgi:hypothetical protein
VSCKDLLFPFSDSFCSFGLLDLFPASAKKSADVTQLQIGVKVRAL